MNNDSSNQKLNNIDNNTVYSPQLSDLEQEINTVKLLIYETNDNALQPKEYDIQKQSCLAQIQALIKKYESDTAAIKTISNSFFGYNMQNTNTAADIVISKDNDINNDKININNFDITKKILNFAQTNNAYNEYILKLAENADKIEIPVLKLLMQSNCISKKKTLQEAINIYKDYNNYQLFDNYKDTDLLLILTYINNIKPTMNFEQNLMLLKQNAQVYNCNTNGFTTKTEKQINQAIIEKSSFIKKITEALKIIAPKKQQSQLEKLSNIINTFYKSIDNGNYNLSNLKDKYDDPKKTFEDTYQQVLLLNKHILDNITTNVKNTTMKYISTAETSNKIMNEIEKINHEMTLNDAENIESHMKNIKQLQDELSSQCKNIQQEQQNNNTEKYKAAENKRKKELYQQQLLKAARDINQIKPLNSDDKETKKEALDNIKTMVKELNDNQNVNKIEPKLQNNLNSIVEYKNKITDNNKKELEKKKQQNKNTQASLKNYNITNNTTQNQELVNKIKEEQAKIDSLKQSNEKQENENNIFKSIKDIFYDGKQKAIATGSLITSTGVGVGGALLLGFPPVAIVAAVGIGGVGVGTTAIRYFRHKKSENLQKEKNELQACQQKINSIGSTIAIQKNIQQAEQKTKTNNNSHLYNKNSERKINNNNENLIKIPQSNKQIDVF